MRNSRSVAAFCAVLLAAFALPAVAGTNWTEKVLQSFNGRNGSAPYDGVISDTAGNLYGTTDAGGKYGDGTVFKLKPPVGGKKAWTETVLFSFNGTNGEGPESRLLFDGAGNLYGTTYDGGSSNLGTVFELTPPGAGQKAWTETVLCSFDGTNGSHPLPLSGLIFDNAGNLYGTTGFGGLATGGTVFKLAPPTPGQTVWTETILFSFVTQKGGVEPEGTLVFDSAGNLYGTAGAGGKFSDGTVFELTPPAPGKTAWKGTVLRSFDRKDGWFPHTGVIFDIAGNLYGTTFQGGSAGGGTVFELTPPSGGQTAWTENVLYNFGGLHGVDPSSGLIFDAAGNLYGATLNGGTGLLGTVFELSPPAPGGTAWTETELYSLPDTGDGEGLYTTLLGRANGTLYGTTYEGGTSNSGIIFQLTP